MRIGADGGANRLLSLELKPDFVVGDLDSLTEANRKQFQASQLHLVADQDKYGFLGRPLTIQGNEAVVTNGSAFFLNLCLFPD